MADLIDRKSLLADWKSRHAYSIPIHAIELLPAVEAEPVVHAHWNTVKAGKDKILDHYYRCSACGGTSLSGCFEHCHHCGAKMDEETQV